MTSHTAVAPRRQLLNTVSGPGVEWAITTNAILSSPTAGEFAPWINAAGSSAASAAPPAGGLAEQLSRLAGPHTARALTDDQYPVVKTTVLG